MKKHLPVIGVGPIYVGVILATTALAILLQQLGLLPAYRFAPLRIVRFVAAALLGVLAIAIWILAVVRDKIGDRIVENTLVTNGIYAWVRNPIYTAFLFLTWAVLLANGNVYFYALGLLHWLFLSLFMCATEEKWLRDLYGAPYDAYCQRVNRCIPWFPKREDPSEKS